MVGFGGMVPPIPSPTPTTDSPVDPPTQTPNSSEPRITFLDAVALRRKELKVSKSTSPIPTPPPGDPPKNPILRWIFPPSLRSIMTTLMSSANPRPTHYPLIDLMTSRSTSRREHLRLLVRSTPSLQQNSPHSVNSSMSTSSPVSSALQIHLTELRFFSSKRKMDNSSYAWTSMVSIGSRRRIATHFRLSPTCWTLLGKPVCIQRSISDTLTTSSTSPKVTNQKPPSRPVTDLTSGV